MKKRDLEKRILSAFLLAFLAVLFSSTTVHAASKWVSCTPERVVTSKNRVYVRCAQAIAGIRYFSAPTQDSRFAARVLSILSTAQVAGRPLSILYNPADLSGARTRCKNSDCRLIIAVGFRR